MIRILIMMLFYATSLSATLQEGATPVLLVRGIDCRDQFLRHLEKAVKAGGIHEVRYASYSPHFGQAGVDEIAAQIAEAALKLKEETGAEKIDVVAFSMGALASRYFIQRLSGKNFVRRFISLSGPHNGTYAAYLRSFIHKGVRDMLPGSEIINDLNSDDDPWGNVQVYSFYSPYDLIVFPATTAILKNSKDVKSFQVALHHQMVKDPVVLSEVVKVLKKPHENSAGAS